MACDRIYGSVFSADDQIVRVVREEGHAEAGDHSTVSLLQRSERRLQET